MGTLPFPPLLDIALDLGVNMAAQDRYRRLLEGVRRAIPCDAAALMRLEGKDLVPVACAGLRADVMGRRFNIAEHPRLKMFVSSDGPVRFKDSYLPDPFDGLMAADADADLSVHACLGVPLYLDGAVIGVLSADALSAEAFDAIDDETIAALGALAAAAMHTARLLSTLQEACLRTGLAARELRAEVEQLTGGELLGSSAPMETLKSDIKLCAGSELTALVTGETGVGKELVARELHRMSARANRPLVYVNCAALTESLAESELFGHVRGAFSGADHHRAGRIEAADGGSVLLDEVGELPLAIQPKLLRFLQEGELQRVGSDTPVRADVRIIAATNRSLEDEVAAGKFRLDLYHRLAVFPIEVPPLRARAEDIDVLAGHFAERARKQMGLGPVRFTAETLAQFHAYEWPGNVRELEHVVLRATLRAAGGRRREPVVVTPRHTCMPVDFATAIVAPPPPENAPAPSVTAYDGLNLADATERFRADRIREALEANDGNWAAAARALGVERSNLHRLGKRLGLR